jgi:hypothetical protein
MPGCSSESGVICGDFTRKIDGTNQMMRSHVFLSVPEEWNEKLEEEEHLNWSDKGVI